MRVISLFSGCGGLDLGFKRAGFEISAAVEHASKCWSTYELNHRDTKLIRDDIKNVNASDFPDDIDGIIGGPPCQSWSSAGLRKGIDDPRGKLFYEYIRILSEIKPKFFIAENVSGMLDERNNKAVISICREFVKSGYDVRYALLNAADYGVPQSRERVFFVGFRSDLKVLFQFPVGSTEDDAKKITLRDAIWDLQNSAVPAGNKNRHNSSAINNNEYKTGGFSNRYMSSNKVKSWDDQAFTVTASSESAQIHPQAPEMVKVADHKYEFVKGKEHLYRRLSVRESARIQTFPDDFEFDYHNVADAYRMIGNAVPVNFAYEIAVQIKKYL